MYKYKVVQEDHLQVELTLSCDVQEPLLVALGALYYAFPDRAAFTGRTEVFQGDLKIMEDQVEETHRKLFSIFHEMGVTK